MDYLGEIDDPRKPSNGTRHDFREIPVIAIAAVLSDSDTVEDIAFWARTKEASLRRFLVLKNGIPSEETFLRVLGALDPRQFEDTFRRWVGGIVGALGGTLAVDGKTVRGSGQRRRIGDPHGQRFCHRTWTGSRSRKGGREKQRDHRDSRVARRVLSQRLSGQHRCDGLQEGDRPEDHRSAR